MKRLRDLMAEEYVKRLETLEREVQSKREEFGEIEDHIKSIQKGFQEKETFAVEKEPGGQRAVIHKGVETRIYSQKAGDLTHILRGMVHQVKDLTEADFIAECNIAGEDSKLVAYISDLMYYDGQDITNKPWSYRRQILKKFSYTDNIKENPCVIVKDKEALEKAVELFTNLKDSEGARIKKYSGTYKLGLSNNFIGFQNGKRNKEPVIDGSNPKNG